jgi:hypothetical protein
MTRCQICGRRKHLRKDQGIAHHHVGGVPCAGIGHPPIEVDDAALVAAVSAAEASDRALTRQLVELYDRRANFIDPQLISAMIEASGRLNRLRRRLDRHRAWPARFAREMERDGWGSPPPQYLIDRE